MKVSFVSIGGNLFLCTLKLMAGILGRSGALISDAVHSAADAIDTIIVIIGIKMASKAPDRLHPYGHERMECVAAILLSIVLGIIGIGIGYAGLEKIVSGRFELFGIPSRLALFAALISIGIKEALYWYMRASAKRINSDSLMAIAWHNRADALSSIGSFIGILGARMGFPILDPLVSVIICVFVIKAAVTIFCQAIGKMIDRTCDEETLEEIRSIINRQEGDFSLGPVRGRLFGDKIYVEAELYFDGKQSLRDTDRIIQKIRREVELSVSQVKQCAVYGRPRN